jgi:predicted  nucleic acid-binding Zn-ribbon protein
MPARDRDDASGVGVGSRATAELRRELAEARDDNVRLEERIVELERQVADLREEHGHLTGEMKHLVRAYERTSESMQAHTQVDLEIRKSNAMAEIAQRGADAKAKRLIRRELAFKAITIAMGLWGILQLVLKARC